MCKCYIINDIILYFTQFINAYHHGKLNHWKTESIDSCMALILLLDQLTRNIYRKDRDQFGIYYYKKYDIPAQETASYFHKTYALSTIKQVYYIFSMMPFRHSQKFEHRKYVVDTNILYEKEGNITNMELWNKFKKESIKSLYSNNLLH